MSSFNPQFSEFTEDRFRCLLHMLKDHSYRFAKYGDREERRHVLWRHDIDVSVHRAYRLATIEAEEGVSATYFVNPRSAFYNFLEPAVMALLQNVRAMGHEIGLHFDADADQITHWTNADLEASVIRDRSILEAGLGRTVTAVSWHNPDLSNLMDFDAEEVGGLRSAYSARMRSNYHYCSDSNGYWRFKPMADVIAEGHPRLHLLTHPEWWTPHPLSPSDRIDRALSGRTRAIRAGYDALLKRGGRKNMGSPSDESAV